MHSVVRPVLDAAELIAGIRIGTAAEMADALTRSRLADDRVVGWYGARGLVLDAELAGQRVPPALAARYGADPGEFWDRWTAAEAAAKASDVPIVLWLRAHGVGPGPVPVRTLHLGPLVVSAAWVLAPPLVSPA